MRNKQLIISGVYKITNVLTNNCYIGSSSRIFYRWITHKGALNKNQHINKHLQRAWNKYGKENFKFEILVKCPKEYNYKVEQWFIDNLHPSYNLTTKAIYCVTKESKKENKKIINKESIYYKCGRRLTNSQIEEIQYLFSTGKYSHKELSYRYNISLVSIFKILKNNQTNILPNLKEDIEYISQKVLEYRNSEKELMKEMNNHTNIDKKKKIKLYNDDNIFLYNFKSLREASYTLSLSPSAISKNINNKTSHCWFYGTNKVKQNIHLKSY